MSMHNIGGTLKSLLTKIYNAVRYWVIDRKIKRTVTRSALRVILGADRSSQEGWISTDISHLNILLIDDWQKYFEANTIDALLAEHVWEHLTDSEAIIAAKNCYEFLKPGGYIRVAVPDGFHPSRAYLDAVKPMGSGSGSDDHKVLFSHDTLTRLLETAGFNVELLEYFDEQGVFHYKEWDSEAGLVTRSMRYDSRNKDGNLNYTSIILDAWKASGGSKKI